MRIQTKILNLSQEPHKLPLPEYATSGDDAVDLKACLSLESNQDKTTFWSILRDYDPHNNFHDIPIYVNDEFILKPHHRVLVPTGLKIALPVGWEAQVKSRSGLALKSGIRVMNSPGTVDSPYRGFIGVILINDSEENFSIKHGDRIAQMALKPSNEYEWIPVTTEDELGATERGDGGFGHTGVSAVDPVAPKIETEVHSDESIGLVIEDLTVKNKDNTTPQNLYQSDVETVSNS